MAQDKSIKNLKLTFAQRFARLREDSRRTQDELAEAVGKSQNLIYRAENDCEISLDAFLLIYSHYRKNYRVNPEWFFTEDNTGLPPYEGETKQLKRQSQNQDRKRAKILEQMLTLLEKEGIIPNPMQNEDPKEGD